VRGRLADLVFVYGTLKRGGKYHPLLADAAWMGELCTPRRYRLFDLGPWPVAMPPVAGQRRSVALHGEVYRMDRRVIRRTLARLDRLEGSAYRRERMNTPWGPAWIYVSAKNKKPGRGRLLPHGVWPPGRRKNSMYS